MNDLQIINKDGKLLTDSRQVAEMTGKNHRDLLRDIRVYIDYIGESNIAQSEFFIESSYVNSQNKEQPCYLLTRKGCDMVANKMTGQKGVLFTAAYVTKFEQMEKQLVTPIQNFEMSMVAAKYSIDILKPSQAGKLKMLETVCKNHNVNTNFLPKYTEEKITKSATELLKEHGSPMSAHRFNQAMIEEGLYEKRK